MSNLKKVLSLATVFMLALSLMGMAAVTYTDRADIDPDYQEAIQMMNELAIMTGVGSEFQPKGNLTRAQLVKMLYVIYNRGNDDKALLQANADGVPFTDTYKNMWYTGYTNWSYIQGIIQGKSPTIFAPNDDVTGFEALKMVLVTMGYSSEREGFTGPNWHLNVLKVANDAGIMDNLKISDLNQPLPREAAAQVLYNAITADMVTYDLTKEPATAQKVYVDGSKSQVETLARKYYDLTTITGVLMSNGTYALDSSDKTDKSVISFDDDGTQRTVEVAGNANLNLVGRTVTAYVKLDKLTGSHYTTKKLYGNVHLAEGEDIVYTDFGAAVSTSSQLEAYIKKDVNDKYTTQSFLGAQYVLNYGAPTASFTGQSIPKGAMIQIIDNGSDKVIDYIFVTNYQFSTVQSADEDTVNFDPAVDKSGSSVRVDTDKILAGDALKADDRVLLIPMNTTLDDVTHAYLLIDPYQATLTGTKGDSKTVFLGDNAYEISGIPGALQDITFANSSENFGVELTYYVHAGYLLEHVAKDKGSAEYAVVLSKDQNTNILYGDPNYFVKLLTDQGEIISRQVDKAFNADGSEITLDASFYSGLKVTDTDTAAQAGIWAYKLVGNDKVRLTALADKATVSGLNYNGVSAKLGSENYYITNKTVSFITVNKGSSKFDFYVFDGKVPEIINGGGEGAVYKDASFASYNRINHISLKVNKADIKLGSNDTYGLITTNPRVLFNNESKAYYGSFNIWLGGESKDMAMTDGLSVSGSDTLVGAADDLGVKRWDLVKVATNAAGVISDIDASVINKEDGNLTGIRTNDDIASSAYLTGYNSRLLRSFSDTAQSGKFINGLFDLASDAKIYSVNTKNGTVAEVTDSALSAARDTKAHLIYVIWDTQNNNIKTVYFFEDVTKNAAGYAAIAHSQADADSLTAIAAQVSAFATQTSLTGAEGTQANPYERDIASSLNGGGDVQANATLAFTKVPGNATDVLYEVVSGTNVTINATTGALGNSGAVTDKTEALIRVTFSHGNVSDTVVYVKIIINK